MKEQRIRVDTMVLTQNDTIVKGSTYGIMQDGQITHFTEFIPDYDIHPYLRGKESIYPKDMWIAQNVIDKT